MHTEENTEGLTNFLVWKFCGKAQFSQSFGRYGILRSVTYCVHEPTTWLIAKKKK